MDELNLVAPLLIVQPGHSGMDSDNRADQALIAGGRNPVQALDAHTVNQIAAGEVVERPASVVKELLENALDAGATRVEIELLESGRQLIRVTDNGVGMTEADARMSLLRHATSKIRAVEDLGQVQTLGFRGEAIPSIASVSKFEIATAVADGMRVILTVEGGEGPVVTFAAGPQGTVVTVEDLFFNVPARRKFLRSDTTELGQILDHVSRYAIAHPEVAIRCLHQGQVALDTPGRGDRAEAVACAWSRDLARSLVEIDADLGGMRLRGFVSPPHVTKTTRGYQYLYVNGRPVRSRQLTTAVDVAFREITPERRFPLLVLMIEIDPSLIDVNVSPTKSEVRFQRDGAVFDAIRHAIKQALISHGMMPDLRRVAAVNQFVRENSPTGDYSRDFRLGLGGELSPETARSHLAVPPDDLPSPIPSPRQPVIFGSGPADPVESIAPGSLAGGNSIEGLPGGSRSGGFSSPSDFPDFLLSLRVIGQAMKLVILAESPAMGGHPASLVMIDQHAAHERILWEKLCGARGRAAIEQQHLLVPVPVELDRRAAVLLQDRLHELREIGFDVEPFGGRAEGGASFLIRSVPAALGGRDPARMFRDLADELVESAVQRRLVPTRELVWITTACRMAIKAGDALSLIEMEELVRQLAECDNPYLCPHGRPIVVSLDREATGRLFKR